MCSQQDLARIQGSPSCLHPDSHLGCAAAGSGSMVNMGDWGIAYLLGRRWWRWWPGDAVGVHSMHCLVRQLGPAEGSLRLRSRFVVPGVAALPGHLCTMSRLQTT